MKTNIALLILLLPTLCAAGTKWGLVPVDRYSGTEARGSYVSTNHISGIDEDAKCGGPHGTGPWTIAMYMGTLPNSRFTIIHKETMYWGVEATVRAAEQKYHILGYKENVNKKWLTTVLSCHLDHQIIEHTRQIIHDLPENKCRMNYNDVDLGTMTNNQNRRSEHREMTIRCDQNTTVKVWATPTVLELTQGANSTITLPTSGIIKANGGTPTVIPMTFDTTVDQDAKAGSYQKSVVITSEIQ